MELRVSRAGFTAAGNTSEFRETGPGSSPQEVLCRVFKGFHGHRGSSQSDGSSRQHDGDGEPENPQGAAQFRQPPRQLRDGEHRKDRQRFPETDQ